MYLSVDNYKIMDQLQTTYFDMYTHVFTIMATFKLHCCMNIPVLYTYIITVVLYMLYKAYVKAEKKNLES